MRLAAIGIIFMGMVSSLSGFAAEEILEPVYLVKVTKTEVENRRVLIGPNKIDAGLREIYLSVTGLFRSVEGRAGDARPDDFQVATDRFTRVTNVLLRVMRGGFDDLVGRAERDQTIKFKVNGLDAKIAYLAAWPKEEVYRALGLDTNSLSAPQPMKYFRFEIDRKDPEKTPVKITEVDTDKPAPAPEKK